MDPDTVGVEAESDGASYTQEAILRQEEELVEELTDTQVEIKNVVSEILDREISVE